MISFANMSTINALRLESKVRDTQMGFIEGSVVNQRAIDSFLEEAPNVDSVDDFVDNYEVFSFVMKAFDLEEKIYAKGMMRQVLKSDLDDENSLVRRLNDPKIRALYDSMSFQAGGEFNLKTGSTQWRQEIVDKYLGVQYLEENSLSNEGLGMALEFREKAPQAETWFGIMGDAETAKFMRTALFLPDSIALLDIDKQKEIFESKYDFEKLKDPEEVEKLITRFAAIYDAQNFQQTQQATSPALQLFSGGSWQFTAISYDIQAIQNFSAGSIYRS